MKAVPSRPAAVPAAPMTYQRLAVSVVSTMGAQTNFQVCGSSDSATSPATCSTLKPTCISTYASVTDM